MATIKQVLDIACQELGVKESPPGSNAVKYNDWFYGRSVMDNADYHYPWCMAFVQWCFDRAGARLPYITASCDGLLSWYYRNRSKSVYKTPLPGDIIIYNFGHTGIVEAVGDGTITAIEGNTSPGTTGSQSNGGMVCRRTRSASLAKAYIRPDYEEGKRVDNTPRISKEAVDWAKANGILKGNKGDLMLSSPCTREHVIVFLWRYHQRFHGGKG